MSLRCSLSSLVRKFVSIVNIAAAIITINIFFSTFSQMAAAEINKDSTTVLAQVEKYQNIWNTHDPIALAAFFTEDADFIMGNLPLLKGRKAIMNWWEKYFKKQEPERRLTIVVNTNRIIAKDVVLINVTTTTGGKDDKGKELLNRKARGTWVLHWENDNWLISAMRGMPTEEDRILRAGGS